MRRVVAVPFLAMQIATASAGDEHATARAAFARHIAEAYDVSAGQIVVQPQYPGQPGNPYDALETPPFLAQRADWPGMDPGPRGFAAADGRVVSARNPAAIADLLEASAPSLSTAAAPEIVRRLMWLYQPDPGNRLIDGHPTLDQVGPPQAERANDGTISASWFVERGGQTGWIGVFRAEFRLPPGGPPRFKETVLP